MIPRSCASFVNLSISRIRPLRYKTVGSTINAISPFISAFSFVNPYPFPCQPYHSVRIFFNIILFIKNHCVVIGFIIFRPNFTFRGLGFPYFAKLTQWPCILWDTFRAADLEPYETIRFPNAESKVWKAKGISIPCVAPNLLMRMAAVL